MPNEKGRFMGRAVEWAWGTSSNNNEQLAVSFKFLGDHANDSPMTRYFSFTDEAFDYSLKALRVCGWQGEDFNDLTGLDANEVQLVLDHEEYNGKRELRIAFVNSAGGIALKNVMPAAEVANFAQRMRGRIQQSDREAGRRVTAPVADHRDSSRPPV